MMTLDEILAAGVLGRDASSLTEEQWRRVDNVVTETLQSKVTARMIYAPVLNITNDGPGVKELRRYRQGDVSEAVTDFDGEPGAFDSPDLEDVLDRTVVHHKEWEIKWRDQAASQRGFIPPLDVRSIRLATVKVALKEDEFAHLGDAGKGIDGFLDPTGHDTLAAPGDFGTFGNGFKTLEKAITQAEDNGILVRPENVRFLLHKDQLSEIRTVSANRQGTEIQDMLESGLIGPDSVHHVRHVTAGAPVIQFLDPDYQTWGITQDVVAEELPRINKSIRGWVHTIQGLQHHEPLATIAVSGA